MPGTIEFISGDGDSGKPPVNTGGEPANTNAGGIDDNPIIDIGPGSEYVKPSAVKFGTDNGGTGSGPRPDGRTRAGRAARGRGTAPGTQAAGESPVKPESKISLEQMVYSFHQGVAALLDMEALTLDHEESKAMADAMTELGRHYAMQFDPKKVAIANLVFVAGGIYGSRIMNWKLKRELAGEKPKNEPTPKVVDIKQPTPAERRTEAMRVPSQQWFEPAGSD